jgi:hypothetical protein
VRLVIYAAKTRDMKNEHKIVAGKPEEKRPLSTTKCITKLSHYTPRRRWGEKRYSSYS